MSDNFIAGYKLYQALNSGKINDTKIARILDILATEDNVDYKLRKIGRQDISDALDEFRVPSLPNDIFDDAKLKLEEYFSQNDRKIRKLVKNMFGFKLPNEINVILCENQLSTDGSSYTTNPTFLGVSINISKLKGAEVMKVDRAAVVLHELIHSLIHKDKRIKNTSKAHIFEEALIEYFLPYGLLSEKLNLSKKISTEKCHRLNASIRPDSAEISEKLLPIIEEYRKAPKNKPIWNALNKTEFKKYLTK